MKSYTLYFEEGDTWTEDFSNDVEAHLKGLQLSRQENLKYQYFEQTEYFTGYATTRQVQKNGNFKVFSWKTS